MMKLVIGNKNYSSWSMRAWVFLRHYGVDFEEIRIPLFTPDYKEQLAEYSPSLRVPALIDGDLTIWDSLAICEYVSDCYLEGAGFPADRAVRGLCRAYCAEMHGGFTSLRNEMPMNCRSRFRVEIGADLQSEIDRIQQLWTQARAAHRSDGAYLFGGFSMADAFFAPVVMRFRAYGIELNSECADYMNTILQNDAVKVWVADASVEQESLPDFHLGDELTD